MARILLVGNAVLDLILDVPHYPAEDEELRALSRQTDTGGNAANTARVLAGRGHDCLLTCTLAEDEAGRSLAARLRAAAVDLRHAVSRPGVTPLSVILRSQATGSRSIAHHRELAELSREDFPLQTALDCDWVHFEGRNIAELTHMIGQLRQHGFAGRVSLEAEKPRAGLAALLTHADVLMFSRPWAEAAGFSEAPTLLASLRADGSGLDATWLATCTWGAAGAWLTDTQGRQYHAPSHLTGPVVDSVGAGDVFNAGLIDALLQGQSAADALHAAVRLAGRKVCQYGYTGL